MKGFAIVLLVLCADVANTQPRQPQQFQVRPSDSPIVLDGRLDETAWQQAAPIPLQYEYFPGDNTPAVVATNCFVTYDRRTLFVACRALEPDIAALRANLADRDVPREDDTVGFMIDPFNDGRRAFQFRVNARGVQMDAFNDDVADNEDWSWDAIWDARVLVGDDGYTAEIGIPFSSLRFPRTAAAQTWGFMAMRDRPRSTRVRMRSAFVPFTLTRSDRREPFPTGRLAGDGADPRAGLSADRQLFSQYLFSYKLNPQTVFLAGYSDNASGTQTVDLTRTDRTFFLKIGYAWVG